MDWQPFVPRPVHNGPRVPSGGEGSTKLEPGMLLKLKDGRVALVGTVNPLLGVCDDCVEFWDQDIAEFCRVILPCEITHV